MSVSVRLDEETKAVLEKTARALRTSKTEVIKRSIRSFCDQALRERARRPYELLKDLVGEEASGRGDLSMRGEEILREHFRHKK